MSDAIISVRNLRKAYRLYSHPGQMVLEALTGRVRHREFVALDDISFEVHPGSVVGIMGRNGAGKSTLLRIVAHTLDVTSGSVDTRGRIAAILELGTGFHLDYTGRENIYFGGICLGLSRREMHERVDEIIEFSELGDFIDRPFRTYSTGMQARLTFSVATCVDPDILIVDEALSVGDAKFALKSFDRIRDFKRRGKAILLVSHSINQITAFCDHAILLDHGRLLAQGEPQSVGNIYYELLFGSDEEGIALSPVPETGEEIADEEAEICGPVAPAAELSEATTSASITDDIESNDAAEDVTPTAEPPPEPHEFVLTAASASAGEHRYGNGAARIIAVEIRDSEGRSHRRLRSLATYDIILTAKVFRPIANLCCGLLIRDARGLDLYGADNELTSDLFIGPQAPGTEVRLKIRFRANLAGGLYFLTLGLAASDRTKYDMRLDAIELLVDPTERIYQTSLANIDAEFALASIRDIDLWSAELVLSAEDMSPDSGYAWAILVENFASFGDGSDFPAHSPLILLEDGMPLGPAHASHDDIRSYGSGRYSHWGDRLYFASSDNSPPGSNGRRYTIMAPKAEPVAGATAALNGADRREPEPDSLANRVLLNNNLDAVENLQV